MASPSPDQAFERLYRASNLTRRQLRAWFGHQLRPHSSQWNVGVRMRLDGALDEERWQRAFALIVAACSSLRSRFVVRDGVPFRELHDEAAVVALEDFTRCADPQQAAADWIRMRSTRHMPLDGRLYDAALLRCGERAWIWYLNQVHMITDGVALEVLAEAVFDLYASAADTERLSAPRLAGMEEYVAAERTAQEGARGEASRSYWSGVLAAPATPTCWLGRRKDPRRLVLTRVSERLDPQRCERLLAAAAAAPGDRKPGLPAMLFAAFARFVSEHCGEQPAPLAVVLHNRRRRAFKRSVGLLMDVLPLRHAVDRRQPLAVEATRLSARLQELLRHDPGGVCGMIPPEAVAFPFNFHRESFRRTARGLHAEQEWIPPSEGSEALALQVTDFGARGELAIAMDLDGEMFPGDEPARTLADFMATLDEVAVDPGAARPVGLGRALATVDGLRAWRLERDDGDGTVRLHAVAERVTTPLELRRALLAALPRAALPDEIRLVPALDCSAIALPRQRTPSRPPAGAAETLLAEIWSEVLGVKVTDAAAHFLDLGGDSLRAVLVAARVEQRTGTRMRPEELFLHDLQGAARALPQHGGNAWNPAS
jgi:acyl carrier protein